MISEVSPANASIPAWDIGRAQGELMYLVRTGEVQGKILDVGCGTGENALYLAEIGLPVLGIDIVPAAVKEARKRANRRGVKASFKVLNALELSSLKQCFDTIIDFGVFDGLADGERVDYIRGLASVISPGEALYLLGLSESEPALGDHRRISQEEIQSTFHDGWRINYIREAIYETNLHVGGMHAWLASITRLPGSMAIRLPG